MNYFKTDYGYVMTSGTVDGQSITKEKYDKAVEESSKKSEYFSKIKEKNKQLSRDEVIDLFISKQVNTLSFDDNVSLKMIDRYPIWEDLAAQNIQLTDDNFENFKFTYKGKLYKAIKPHTFSSAWIPGVGTESLYIRIDEEHDGDVYDPIPYEGNMVLVNGKYYTQDNVVYLCFRDTVNQVNNPLSELVEIYVKIVDITNL